MAPTIQQLPMVGSDPRRLLAALYPNGVPGPQGLPGAGASGPASAPGAEPGSYQNLYGGPAHTSPSATVRGYSPGTVAAAMTSPPRTTAPGSFAAAMPAAPTAAPPGPGGALPSLGASAPAAASGSPVQSSYQNMFGTPPLSREDYLAQHPVAPLTPPPYQDPGWKQNVGMALAAGAASVRDPQVAAGMMSNYIKQIQQGREQVREFPLQRQQEESQAYQQYVAEQREKSQIPLAGAEANRAEAEAEKARQEAQNAKDLSPAIVRKGQFLERVRQEALEGRQDPAELKKGALSIAFNSGINVLPAEIEEIIANTKSQAPIFKLGATGMPEPIIYKGKVYGISPGAAEPPEVTAARNDALATHQAFLDQTQAKEDRQLDRQTTLQDRLNANQTARQGRVFEHQHEMTAEGKFFKSKQDANAADAAWQEAQKLAAAGAAGDSASDKFLLEKAAGQALPTGVRRLNPQIVDSLKNSGSLPQRAEAELRNWTVGSTFTPETRRSILNAIKTTTDTAKQKAGADADAAAQLYGVQNRLVAPGAGGPAQPGVGAGLHPADQIKLKITDKATVQQYARDHSMNYDQALQTVIGEGYKVR